MGSFWVMMYLIAKPLMVDVLKVDMLSMKVVEEREMRSVSKD